jgi:hypothetical protein
MGAWDENIRMNTTNTKKHYFCKTNALFKIGGFFKMFIYSSLTIVIGT